MANLLYTDTKEFKRGNVNDTKFIGGITKSSKLKMIDRLKTNQEDLFMSFAYKVGRSDKQREERRQKRK